MSIFSRALGHTRILAATATLAAGATLAAVAYAQAIALDGAEIGSAQVETGQSLYDANCAGCHGEDLRSTDSNAPDLRGPSFAYSWGDAALGEKHAYIAANMPPGRPGTLSDQEYLDVVAYILSVNGVEPVEGESLSMDDDLSAVTVRIP